ncbi:four helix bundle protein [Lentimicrobium sp. S6]|uniref:four helix bundle protein n=1 Tax=Lentimicrobium sp. S6 TaxID=2735872 RepID=UPI0015557EFF|nr:four helix bundle protein [Lentimicrobium sp. S6]NPD48325.1 four helix bundle protein [Lentimicrobium sp. S6]
MLLEDFQVYNLSMEIGEEIYSHVIKWDYFQKDTIGKQLIRSSDSIAANLSEGLGRYHYKERKNFSFYSRGSLFETKTWITKANNRGLIDDSIFKEMMEKLNTISVKLNNYIKTLGPDKER